MALCVRPKTSGTARTGPSFDGHVLRLKARPPPDRGPSANLEAEVLFCVISDAARMRNRRN